MALHALCDALLGAATLGDIGKHFPDTDAQYKGVDSRILLRHVYGKVQEKGYKAVNVDVTIIAQAPKMAPHIPQMREYIAADLGLDVDAVNVKATTTEGMGFEGRGEGISSMAVACWRGRDLVAICPRRPGRPWRHSRRAGRVPGGGSARFRAGGAGRARHAVGGKARREHRVGG